MSGSGLDALLPDVFAPWASCKDAAVLLFGLPYEFWSLGLFVVTMGVAGWVLIRSLNRGRPGL
jgi:disulfide bond formation protein DsbB